MMIIYAINCSFHFCNCSIFFFPMLQAAITSRTTERLKMDKSPSHRKYETGEEYDPELDFAQFLKEARTHACRAKSVSSSLHASEEQFGERTKAKKSWKSYIFSWMKAEKKTIIIQDQRPMMKTAQSKSKTRQGYVSGPINGIKSCRTERPKRPSSGPLSGLFNQRKKMEESQMPYISLGQLNSPTNLPSYGPVYLVT